MKKLLIPFSAVALLAGCRTTEDILNDYEKDLVAGAYAHAAVEVGEMAAKEDDSVVLWRLQTGAAKYLADDKAGALEMFDRVEDAFAARDQSGAVSAAGQSALAMITNERAVPYAGTGEDRIFTSFYKAVDYAAQGRRDAARTELNRAAQRQENWLWERRSEIKDAEESLKKSAASYAKKEKTSVDSDKANAAADKAVSDSALRQQFLDNAGFDPASSGRLENLSKADYLNAYVQHATGVFRWLNGDDGARDFFQYALDVKPDHPLVTSDCASCQGTRPVDQVWIYVEDGLCSVRREWRIDLPLVFIPYANRYVQYAGMAFPKLVARSSAASGYTVSLDGAPRVPLTELEDVDRLLRTEFDVYMSGCVKREIARTVLKVGVQVGFGVAAETTNNSNAKLAFRIAQIGAATWALTTTAADLRSWTALPKTVYALRVPRPANGRIVLEGDGRPVAELTVPKGNAMVFVRRPSALAPAVVKTVTFGS